MTESTCIAVLRFIDMHDHKIHDPSSISKINSVQIDLLCSWDDIAKNIISNFICGVFIDKIIVKNKQIWNTHQRSTKGVCSPIVLKNIQSGATIDVYILIIGNVE